MLRHSEGGSPDKTACRLVVGKNGTCFVEVHEPGRDEPITQIFSTKADAERWIAEQQRMADIADRWERHAPRNWRD